MVRIALLLFILVSCSKVQKKSKQPEQSSEVTSVQQKFKPQTVEDTPYSAQLLSCKNGQLLSSEWLKNTFKGKGMEGVFLLGTCYKLMEKWDKAYYYFRQVSLLGETPEIKARALNNVGAMHWLRGKYRLAYENFKESQGLQENPKTLYNIVGAEIFLGAEVALENNYLLMKKMPITETQWLCQKFLAEWTLKKYEEGISTYKQLLAQSLGKNDTLLFHLRALEMALKIGQQDTIKKIVSDHRTNFSLSTEYKNFSTLYPEIKKYE